MLRDREILERLSHKDSGGMDGVSERALSIDEQNFYATPGKQTGALKPSQPGADNYGIE